MFCFQTLLSNATCATTPGGGGQDTQGCHSGVVQVETVLKLMFKPVFKPVSKLVLRPMMKRVFKPVHKPVLKPPDSALELIGRTL